jgi:hypothetical protein
MQDNNTYARTIPIVRRRVALRQAQGDRLPFDRLRVTDLDWGQGDISNPKF